MGIHNQHKFTCSLTVLPSVTNASCSICFEGDVSLLQLSCKHFVCAPCGTKADSYGLNTCPTCRAPAVLDIDKMLSAFDSHRQGYASWRQGRNRGAVGEPADIRVPSRAQMTCFKGTLHHNIAGTVWIHRQESRLADKLKAKPAPMPAPKSHGVPLIHSVLVGHAFSESSAIVFAWWPKSSMWTAYRVDERAQRALSALRPGVDLITLPDTRDSRAIFEAWCNLYGFQEWQVIYFDPMLHVDEGGKLTTEDIEARPDRSAATLETVLEELAARYPDAAARSCLHLYHSHLSASAKDRIVKAGFVCVGDTDEHPVIGSLAEAKGWLHADFDSSSQRPSLARSLATGEIRRGSVHVPRGYVCHSAAEQRAAFKELKAVDSTTRVVLKPTDGLGCAGLVLDAKEEDLAPTDHADYLKGESYTVEEMIGAKGGISPTVYMIGSTPIAVADQLMDGTCNLGNISPSNAEAALQAAMAEAGEAIGKHLNLTGQWGLDFVVDKSTGSPVVVDLNMGRPNGSLAYYMWRSAQTCPGEIHQIVVSRTSQEGGTVAELIDVLRDSGLLWRAGCAEGVVPAQFLSGASSSVILASRHGRGEALALLTRLQEFDRSGTYRFTAN